MTRAKKVSRLAGTLAGLWMVAGADWPVGVVLDILGGIRCC